MIRLYIAIAAAAALIAGYFAFSLYYIGVGKDQCETEIVYKELEIRDKRNEISNNRPDDTDFFDGLLNDPNW